MKVVIIFNPNSTGDSEKNAKDLARTLRVAKVDVSTRSTTHAGHGEEIAAKYAESGEEIVLISSSGDGGYHEVVNGAVAHKAKKLVVGVLASGNANDHSSSIGSDSLAKAIIDEDFHHIDTIKLSATVDGKPWVRYAHSYVGIGVTATAAKQLTEERPNIVTEKWIVARSLLSFSYVKLKEKTHTRRYSSILFGNVNTMSKVIKLSDKTSVTDGKFEMSSIRFRSKLRLLVYLVSAATLGLKSSQSLKSFKFKTISKLPIQMDGESYVLDANCKVKVESAKRNLYCVL